MLASVVSDGQDDGDSGALENQLTTGSDVEVGNHMASDSVVSGS